MSHIVIVSLHSHAKVNSTHTLMCFYWAGSDVNVFPQAALEPTLWAIKKKKGFNSVFENDKVASDWFIVPSDCPR